MIKKKYVIFIFLLFCNFTYSQTAQEVFNRVNNVNKDFSTMEFKAVMEIESRGRKLTKNFFGYLNDKKDYSFMEYSNPQDYGTRYLKLKDDMWIYMPDANDVLKISGHLLRDGMMGSDISYDDMMDQGSLETDYKVESLSTVELNGESVYLLTIKAKDKNKATYAKQDLFVNKNNYNIEKITMYAKGRKTERAIKEFILKDYAKVGHLSMPMVLEVSDLRKRNSMTTIKYTDIKIDIDIDPSIFTRIYLEK